MLRITIELLPHGDVLNPEVLGVGYIMNTGAGTATSGDYFARLLHRKKTVKSGASWKQGSIFDFPRKRLGPWDLLYRALHVMVGDRNTKILEKLE